MGLPRLVTALETHLGTVTEVLVRHGYTVTIPWRMMVRDLVSTGPATVLHGDLADGNVVRGLEDGGLLLLDACGYIGPAAFDAARWAARIGGVQAAQQHLHVWQRHEVENDSQAAYKWLGLELLMQAGVRELVKDERRCLLAYPDAVTQQYVTLATELTVG